MRKRLTKKILGLGPNQHFSYVKLMVRMQRRLRPERTDEHEQTYFPSCHDIPIIARAWTRVHRLIRKYGSAYKTRTFPKYKNNNVNTSQSNQGQPRG